MADILKEISNEIDQLNTIEEILDMAILLEEQNRTFYMEKGETIKKAGSQELYDYLADEEGKHVKFLQQYKNDKNIPDLTDVHDIPDFKESFAAEFTKEDMDEIGVLLSALRLERKNEYFYIELARRQDKGELKDFFELLASIERGHYELIDGMLDIATGFRMQT
jgi:rubrerythrin